MSESPEFYYNDEEGFPVAVTDPDLIAYLTEQWDQMNKEALGE